MKGDANKQFDDLLESLRSSGDAKLASQVEKVRVMEREMSLKLMRLHGDFLREAEAAGLPEALACGALCQVYAHAYAISIACLDMVMPEAGKNSLTAVAISCLIANLEKKFDEVGAIRSDIGGKVKEAARKVGPLPDKGDGE